MKRLDAYIKITCDEATNLATEAIAGLTAMRQARACEEADRFAARVIEKPGFISRIFGRTVCLQMRGCTENPKEWLEQRCHEIRANDETIHWEDPEYDYWWAITCLRSDELRAAKALLAASEGGGKKDRHVLINPEDMAEMRAWGRQTRDLS